MRAIRDVARHRGHVRSEVAERPGDLLEGSRVTCGHDEVEPVGPKESGEGLAEALARSRDEREPLQERPSRCLIQKRQTGSPATTR